MQQVWGSISTRTWALRCSPLDQKVKGHLTDKFETNLGFPFFKKGKRPGMVLPLIPAWQRQAECQAKEGCIQRPPCLYHSWDIGQFSAI